MASEMSSLLCIYFITQYIYIQLTIINKGIKSNNTIFQLNNSYICVELEILVFWICNLQI